jgi:predicted acylesterase/phospholipase RssA
VPMMSVVKAIRVSCCIPILLTPFLIDDCYYMDGCLYNNFPIDYFRKNHKLKDIIGINILFKKYQSTDTFFSYVFFIINSLLDKANTKSVEEPSNNIVTIEFDENDWLSLIDLCIKFPKEKWTTYIQHGYNAIKDKLSLS